MGYEEIVQKILQQPLVPNCLHTKLNQCEFVKNKITTKYPHDKDEQKRKLVEHQLRCVECPTKTQSMYCALCSLPEEGKFVAVCNIRCTDKSRVCRSRIFKMVPLKHNYVRNRPPKNVIVLIF